MEFWESSFIDKQTMWGFEPTDSAILIKDFFLEKNVKDILIPGIGYGRNAKVFIENGINVTGIEISKTAIGLARENGIDSEIFHGSVTDMPFDNKLYDGIFSHALIHLLNEQERKKFIKDCYDQLKPNGYMIFTTVSKKAPMFGKGKQLDKDYFEIMEGVKMFFYDSDSIKQEFGDYGLVEFSEIDEPNKDMKNKPSINFILVKCKKK
ncbi:class I SAM-dependent methyltransferase [Heyndrickxia oleronia]|jgi:SAM-dependent methyltransferase|uniref:SAM-dependent methyltransferase n=1 Tax=Heyndrickxia oleronia TaxID=38875 RepID=A0A8E2LE79_9BACI|nr:class I SAM-dependent methyltransferase [Heyndrickxia oleronia]MCI1590510.1 class I SAM-dependent methyltransferase [Heyndrickxia oleronia]MCI1612548.1 class I SAM-dependent methyltransferase [Heyndrickxia oleronia]MCI1743775.1 class I SAM-dependent methyltransferase [Heyndrickxia oleronia]MCI1760485.1 class I SAM-dependent methyltransferase [Heyndrickxia oleronia]MEC1374424.1 class I SAM-dependent methyltransferase [Heyndrickxia oleronia]